MDLAELIRAYAASTVHFEQAVAALPAEAIDRAPADGWSPRMVVHHLADAETVAHGRLRRLLAEPAPVVIQGFDEQAWADCPALGYRDLPIEHALALFTAVRASSFDLVERLTPADLERSGQHTDGHTVTIAGWLEHHINHANAHTEQLERAARGEA